METKSEYYLEHYILADNRELYSISPIIKSLGLLINEELIRQVVGKLLADDYQVCSIDKDSWYIGIMKTATQADWPTGKKEIEATTSVHANTTQTPIPEKVYLTRQGVQHFISALEELFKPCPHFIPYAQFLVRYWGHYKSKVQEHIQTHAQKPPTPPPILS